MGWSWSCSAQCWQTRSGPQRRSRPAASGPRTQKREGPGSLPALLGLSVDLCLGGEDELVAERQLEPGESSALELPDALARQAELLADRLQRGRLGVEPEPELDDPALPLRPVRHPRL